MSSTTGFTEVLNMSESASTSRSGSTIDSTLANLNDEAKGRSLTVITAAVFIVGAICGGGVLAIPQAIVDCGYIGPIVLIACGLISAFTGNLLGKCWTILRVRYPEYENERITDPYPTIAYRAGGKVAKYATRICIDVTLFGGATVFLLLICGNISELMHEMSHVDFSLCWLLLIVAACLAPFTWLGTPKDFWQAAAMAALTSVVAAIFVFSSLITAIPHHKNPEHSSPEWSGFFSAFGTILFAFGGASCFPTIQVDMKEPNKFPISVVIGIFTVLTVYLLVGVTGFLVLGDAMEPNVVTALPAGWISYTVNILITIHLLMAYVIVNNPVAQGIEGYFGIPDAFCLKRILIRTLICASSMFVALTIPHFSIILSLLGGSTIALTNFIFPPLYYYLLSRQRTPSAAYGPLPSYIQRKEVFQNDNDDASILPPGQIQKDGDSPGSWMQVDISLHLKVALFEIIMIGIVGGISSTYFSFASLINGESGFTVPCYVNISVGLPT